MVAVVMAVLYLCRIFFFASSLLQPFYVMEAIFFSSMT